MDPRTRAALLARSFPTFLIDKVGGLADTVTTLQHKSAEQLRRDYTEDEIEIIQAKIVRQEIPAESVKVILELSAEVCSYCADGVSSRPYEIHHIDLYSATQNHEIDNLMVVCPTHHTVIHRKREPSQVQKNQRRKWYEIARIARAYATKGIIFPFESFEVVDYAGELDLSAIPQLRPLNPATALALTHSAWGDAMLHRLMQSHVLVVSGWSGSGKSTLLLGVGGMLARRQAAAVLRYRPPRDTRLATAELLLLFSQIVEPTIVLLDDIQSWLSSHDFDSLVSAINGQFFLIASISSGDPNATSLEAHCRQFLEVISWKNFGPLVRSTLARHEVALKPILSSVILSNSGTRVGDEVLDIRYRDHLRNCVDEAETVWEFCFLFGGGWSSIRSDVNAFLDADSSYLPILYACIEQIAEPERAVDPTDALSALSGFGIAGNDAHWVSDVFERGCERRIIVRRRRAFRTIHRRWACAFIAECIATNAVADGTRALLDRDFSLNSPKPRRLLILWNWFYYEGGAMRVYLDRFRATVSQDGFWNTLVGNAARADIVTLALAVRRMHREYLGPQLNLRLAEAAGIHRTEIAARIREATAEDWHWLYEIISDLEHADPKIANEVLSSWAPARVAELIHVTAPDQWEMVTWFLGSASKRSDPWIREVGANFSWTTFRVRLKQLPPGDIDTALDAIDIVGRLGCTISRFIVRDVVDEVCRTGESVVADQVRFRGRSGDAHLFNLLPMELVRILESFDLKKLTSSFEESVPRDWGTLSGLFIWARGLGIGYAERFFDALDVERFRENVARQARFSAYGVRVLLWTISYASAARALVLAEAIYPSVLAAARGSERQYMIQAAQAISPELAKRICGDLGVPFDGDAIVQDDDFEPETRSKERLAAVEAIEQDLAAAEAAGTDYDIGAILRRVFALPP